MSTTKHTIIEEEISKTCSAANICRPLNLPVAVGTGNATKLVKTGYWLELDELAGRVRYKP